ncbi:MAG: penicillin-binding protein [Rhodospirillaceae bacterium]|nr:penicillin-binding protein [Rhodospirillaceae bacterium]OUT77057.1 MAG: hypothetical protein CBB83_10225 [Rhodospirillaceae bacterium TMED23]|tara:strand:+ start:1875 stop:3629 length:1755 start_codon:yes stop_codon:yes gene_type:complete
MIFERIQHPFRPSEKANLYLKKDNNSPIHIKFNGARRLALETGRNRLLVAGALFTIAFALLAGRLIELAIFNEGIRESRYHKIIPNLSKRVSRANIKDRNGILLATSLPTASLYANPRQVFNPTLAAAKLSKIFPTLDQNKIESKLSSKKSFVWLQRNLTPNTQFLVNTLGIPGLKFQRTERRVYPHGKTISHVLGLTDIDGRGLSGVESYFDNNLFKSDIPIMLSLDVRLQSVLREELLKSMNEFTAIGAAGIIMDVTNGEVRAMSSLPDFNPNKPITASGIAGFNRATKGIYEMGSTFKLFTVAMALDSGIIGLKNRYDATKPIKISRHKISDYHAKNRWLSVSEIMAFSSNIGIVKIAQDVGPRKQKHYLRRFGLLTPTQLKLPEIGYPKVAGWREINTVTMSYGHGIAVSPIQLISGVAALVNGGTLFKPRIRKISRGEEVKGVKILSDKTSKKMRDLMRVVVRYGTGKKADVPGYLVGGKTGTADKPGPHGGYGKRRILSSFVGAFPMNNPRYAILLIVDEPKGIKRTHGYATGGWVAAPAVANIIKRMAPLLGLRKSEDKEFEFKPGDDLFISVQNKS